MEQNKNRVKKKEQNDRMEEEIELEREKGKEGREALRKMKRIKNVKRRRTSMKVGQKKRKESREIKLDDGDPERMRRKEEK